MEVQSSKFKVQGWFMLAMAVGLPLFAQAPPVQDPLMNLMLTQPRIDISTNVTATAAFEPPSVGPGEEAVYRVTLNALEESITWPAEISTSSAAAIRAGAHGQVFQMGPGVLQPRTSFLYHIRPSEAGQLSVPAFDIKVGGKTTTVPAAILDVTNEPPSGTAPAQRLALEMEATNLYAGQPVRTRVSFSAPNGGPAQGLMQVQFAGEGFVVDQSAIRQRFEARPRAGGNSLTYIYETTLTPLTAGKLSVFGQGFTSGSRFAGSIVINGPGSIQMGPPQYLLLDSDPLELDVKPLPRKGELPGFTGAIGKFSLDAPTLEGNSLRVGDPVKLSVVVRSDNSAVRLVAPPPPNSPGWQIVVSPDTAATSAPLGNPQLRGPGIQVGQLPACATFSYTLIPQNEKETNTPAIPFSYFDPARGTYMDLTIPAVSVSINPAATTADSQPITKADSAEARIEVEPGLSDLAAAPGLASTSLIPVQRRPWFPLLQAAPGAAFLGLWGWDRRRRYLEKHPDILLRRRARRALRRERHAMQQAARAGDACRFTTRAVDALRIACAPFYPAEPHALVGSDVLEQLPESGPMANARAVVRRFFAAADAATFDANPAEANALLAMRPEIEKVLAELEARLQT
jgi:hypothetical protein